MKTFLSSSNVLRFARRFRQRIFAHYVLGRLAFLFFICHPGTLATFGESKVYLENRYPNRLLDTSSFGKILDSNIIKRDQGKPISKFSSKLKFKEELSPSRLAFVHIRPISSKRPFSHINTSILSTEISFSPKPRRFRLANLFNRFSKRVRSNADAPILDNDDAECEQIIKRSYASYLESPRKGKFSVGAIIQQMNEAFESASGQIYSTKNDFGQKLFGEYENSDQSKRRKHGHDLSYDLVGFMDFDFHRSFNWSYHVYNPIISPEMP